MTGVRPLPEPTWDEPVDVAAGIASLTASNVDSATLAEFERLLEAIVDLYGADGPTGPARLAEQALKLRRHVQSLLKGHQSASRRVELFRLAARTSAVLGYMAVNTGRHHLVAEAYCAEAVELARDITDVETTMWAIGTRSLNSYYQGDYARLGHVGRHRPPARRLSIRRRAGCIRSTAEPGPLGGSGTAHGTVRAIGAAEDLSSRHALRS